MIFIIIIKKRKKKLKSINYEILKLEFFFLNKKKNHFSGISTNIKLFF